MKKKSFLLMLGGLFAFSLAACNNSGGGNPTTQGQPTTTTTQGQPTTTAQQSATLAFMSDNKIRIDIMDENLGVTFNYGNEAVVSEREINYVDSTNLSMNGSAAVDKVNFIFVMEKSTGSRVSVSKGLNADSLENYLSGSGRKISGCTKVYIAISTGDLKWNKNLSEPMNELIKPYDI